jgi:hypothetical protein
MDKLLLLLLLFELHRVHAIVTFESIEEIFTSNKSLVIYEAEARGSHLHFHLEFIRPVSYLNVS